MNKDTERPPEVDLGDEGGWAIFAASDMADSIVNELARMIKPRELPGGHGGEGCDCAYCQVCTALIADIVLTNGGAHDINNTALNRWQDDWWIQIEGEETYRLNLNAAQALTLGAVDESGDYRKMAQKWPWTARTVVRLLKG